MFLRLAVLWMATLLAAGLLGACQTSDAVDRTAPTSSTLKVVASEGVESRPRFADLNELVERSTVIAEVTVIAEERGIISDAVEVRSIPRLARVRVDQGIRGATAGDELLVFDSTVSQRPSGEAGEWRDEFIIGAEGSRILLPGMRAVLAARPEDSRVLTDGSRAVLTPVSPESVLLIDKDAIVDTPTDRPIVASLQKLSRADLLARLRALATG